MTIQTPEWVKHAVFYQIFPDRFARSPRMPHPPGITFAPWGSPPGYYSYQGGDLYGVADRLGYLQDLGITAIYLNPIFASASNHRYHTYDYMQVDPLLGGNAALRELLDAAHARGIRVVLDGVFNHASRGFWAFHHILENGPDSPYIDWFIIRKWPLRPYNSSKSRPPNYEAWWGLPALPKLNTANPGVRQYIMDVARHWIAFGIDGWRLDVPAEIDDDTFWQQFRQVVKAANPEAYIVGEIWHEAQRWLQGDQFDAVMNYMVMDASLSLFGAGTLRRDYRHPHLTLKPLDGAGMREQVEHMLGLYAPAITQAQLNLIDSHDTPRALWLAGEDKSALRLCTLFQMTYPGAPCIYYGDEVGMTGGDDPACRGAFPWHDEAAWDRDLLDHYRCATALRHAVPALRTGSFEHVDTPEGVYGYVRALQGQTAVVLFNTETIERALEVTLPASAPRTYSQAWPEDGGAGHHVVDGTLSVSIPPRDALVLVGGDAGG